MTKIFDACKDGDISVVKDLLTQANIEDTDSHGRTLLIISINERKEDIVELLIQQGANLNAKNESGNCALILASSNGLNKIVHQLLINGANPNIRSKQQRSCLMMASKFNRPEIVELLIKKGAHLNYKSREGDTALMGAVDSKHHNITEILIKAGADISIKNNEDRDPFAIAMLASDYISMVLLKPELINKQNRHGDTMLSTACGTIDEKTILFLYEKGACFHIENKHGDSAYDILTKQEDLPEKLQMLKEKLMLDQLISQEDNYSLGL